MAILETAEHWSRVRKWLNLEKYIWDREPGALTGSKLLRNFRSFPAPGAELDVVDSSTSAVLFSN